MSRPVQCLASKLTSFQGSLGTHQGHRRCEGASCQAETLHSAVLLLPGLQERVGAVLRGLSDQSQLVDRPGCAC